MALSETEKKLGGLSNARIDEEMSRLEADALIQLLDSRCKRIGNAVADLLSRKGATDAVIDGVLSKRISTKSGKTRALAILNISGKKSPRAVEAYSALILDKHKDVIDWALFGLVFFQDRRSIQPIQEAMKNVVEGSDIHQRYQLALEALEKTNPFVFAPFYHDAGNVWQLDKERFKGRIG